MTYSGSITETGTEMRSYYGRPILKEPVWQPEIPFYFFTGGVADARLYGEDPGDGVGGDGAFFLLLDEPEVYGLPPDPVVTTRDLPTMWRRVGVAAATLAAGAAAAFAVAALGGRR